MKNVFVCISCTRPFKILIEAKNVFNFVLFNYASASFKKHRRSGRGLVERTRARGSKITHAEFNFRQNITLHEKDTSCHSGYWKYGVYGRCCHKEFSILVESPLLKFSVHIFFHSDYPQDFQIEIPLSIP